MAGDVQRVGTEINFTAMMSLSATVAFGTGDESISLREPFHIYLYSRIIAGTSTFGFGDVPRREGLIKFLNDDPVPLDDAKSLLLLTQWGVNQSNYIDLFVMYLIPLLGDKVCWIPTTITQLILLPTAVFPMPENTDARYQRNILAGIFFKNQGHFVPYIILWKKMQLLYLEPMGAKNEMPSDINECFSKLIEFLGRCRRFPVQSSTFEIIRLDLPSDELKQPSGTVPGDNSCMVRSCVIFFVFLKYLCALGRDRTNGPTITISDDKRSYDLSVILKDRYVSEQGLKSVQRGLLSLIFKTMEYNEFWDAEKFDNIVGKSISFAKLSQSERMKQLRGRLSVMYKVSDPTWTYVLTGDCGIPREVMAAYNAMTKDKANLDKIIETFSSSKLAMLMFAKRYNIDQQVLLTVFNAIPDVRATKTLSNHKQMKIFTFPMRNAVYMIPTLSR